LEALQEEEQLSAEEQNEQGQDWYEEAQLGQAQVEALVAAMGSEGGSMTTAAEISFHFEVAWREAQLLVAIEKGFVRLERDEEDPGLWYVIRIEDGAPIWQFRPRKAPNRAIGLPEFN